jgi:heat-inducible transcriptional repressor
MSAARISLDDRKALILRAIVSHYVRSGDPVGSRTVAERFPIKVSPATVRNDMAALEGAGLIFQPHTSAGRVPTDAGYRYFVDEWAAHSRLPATDILRLKTFFDEPRWELEDSLRSTASLLSELTHHAAVVFAPSLDRSVVRHVELVDLGGNRAMLVLVTNTGRVENHVTMTSESVDSVQLTHTAEMLNRLIAGTALETVAAEIRAGMERFPLELRETVAGVAQVLDEQHERDDGERFFLDGTSNIVDEQNFADLESVRQVISALEHKRVLLELVADALALDRVSVRIGSENSVEEMQSCSVIAASYGFAGSSVGSIGVVGPTRMDYQRAIAAVHQVADHLGRMLTGTNI